MAQEPHIPDKKPATKHRGADRHHSPQEMNRVFTRPDLDVVEFVRRFEGEHRDIATAKEAILDATGLKPGDEVADVGAGTGLFTREFARRVGKTGRVYAVEIAPAFLNHIAAQAAKSGDDDVITPVLAGPDKTHLPPESVDVVFLCATYHHFEHPERNLASIVRALRPGGRVILIDFDQARAKNEFAREHARGPKETYIAEFEKAGLKLNPSRSGPPLQDNFYAEFVKPSPAVEH